MSDMLTVLLKMGIDPSELFKPFKPCTMYIPKLDWFFYLEKDCSYSEEYIKGSNIELLFDNHNDKKIVGVKIKDFSHVIKLSDLKMLQEVLTD